jgi:SPP1 gp7 family putative phage head morphogenesis protein
MAANDEILDAITSRALDLQRLTASQRRSAARFLNELEGEIVAALAKIDPTGVGSTSARARRLEKLLDQVRDTIRAAYRAESTRLRGELRELADLEATFAASSVNKVVGVGLLDVGVTRGQLTALVGDVLIEGAPVSDWLSRQAGDTLQRFTDNMRSGIAQGETNAQLIRRIRGGTQNGEPVKGFMDISRRNAETLVRSATQAVSQKARQATYDANSGLIKALQWVSTIDLRTTVICAARDGLLYTVDTHEPIDHDLPWGGGPGNLHFGCRSTSAPVLKSFRDLGLDLDEVPPSTRASLDGQVPEDITFEGWLSRQSKARQAEVLGPGRAELWRDGKLSFRDLIDGNGRELTLEQLRQRT